MEVHDPDTDSGSRQKLNAANVVGSKCLASSECAFRTLAVILRRNCAQHANHGVTEKTKHKTYDESTTHELLDGGLALSKLPGRSSRCAIGSLCLPCWQQVGVEIFPGHVYDQGPPSYGNTGISKLSSFKTVCPGKLCHSQGLTKLG
eukprot:4837635-Amphidinium_carterae.1